MSGAPLNAVPVLGTARRIRALVAIGHPMVELGARMGWPKQNVSRVARMLCPTILLANAEKWAAIYDELSMIPGSCVRSRLHAQRLQWGPPLAWDDIDDPDEVPQLDAQVDDEPDENLVRAFIADRAPAWSRLTRADRQFLCTELKRRGYTRNAVALATHASHNAVRHYWDKVSV